MWRGLLSGTMQLAQMAPQGRAVGLAAHMGRVVVANPGSVQGGLDRVGQALYLFCGAMLIFAIVEETHTVPDRMRKARFAVADGPVVTAVAGNKDDPRLLDVAFSFRPVDPVTGAQRDAVVVTVPGLGREDPASRGVAAWPPTVGAVWPRPMRYNPAKPTDASVREPLVRWDDVGIMMTSPRPPVGVRGLRPSPPRRPRPSAGVPLVRQSSTVRSILLSRCSTPKKRTNMNPRPRLLELFDRTVGAVAFFIPPVRPPRAPAASGACSRRTDTTFSPSISIAAGRRRCVRTF